MVYPQRCSRQTTHRQINFHTEFYVHFYSLHSWKFGSEWYFLKHPPNRDASHTPAVLCSVLHFCLHSFIFVSIHAHLTSLLGMAFQFRLVYGNLYEKWPHPTSQFAIIKDLAITSVSVSEQSLCNFCVAGFPYSSSYNVISEHLLFQDERNKTKVYFTTLGISFRE
jgi:hypothetical protein